jgi:integrase
MYSKSAKPSPSIANRGSVPIKTSNGRLQLVFTYAGVRQYLSLGLTDSPANRQIASAKAKLIESDIIYERFDPTLEKYKPQKSSATPKITPIVKVPTLAELWEKYTQYKSTQIAASTLARDYAKIARHVKKLPYSIDNPVEVRDWLLKKYSSELVRRTLVQINACCNWSVKSGLISHNPFLGMHKDIKRVKRNSDRTPFTAEERDCIISAFENNTYSPKFAPTRHSYYFPYVKFLFMTGCRPEEAAALQWKHIQGNCERIRFEEAIPSDTRIRGETKTHKARPFPCNKSLQEFLLSIKPTKASRNDFVFPSPRGGVLDTHNFLNRIWKPVVLALVDAGKVQQYLPQYHARHTFITLMLDAGVDAKDVAKWVGNSPEIIYKHYAGNSRHLSVPEV